MTTSCSCACSVDSSTTRRRGGPRTALHPAPVGTTSRRTGAARTAARPSRTSRWSRLPGRDLPGRAERRVMTMAWASAATGSDNVAPMPEPIRGAPTGGGSAQRVPFAEASRVLLRHSILDGMRDMLLTRDWSSITLSDVARAAGISRQTIYNEFGSRQGLAEGYALRLADRLVDAIHAALDANVGNIYEAFLAGFRSFFAESASDPLVISLLSGVAKPDLQQLITTDSAPIITRA